MSGDIEYKYDGADMSKLERYVASMEVLLRSEGWKWMERDMRSAEDSLLFDIANCANPNDLLRMAGKLSMIRNNRNFPDRMLKQALADLTKLRALKEQKNVQRPTASSAFNPR